MQFNAYYANITPSTSEICAPEVSYGVSSTALASAPMAHSAAAAPGAFWRSATEPQGAARCCKVLQCLATVL